MGGEEATNRLDAMQRDLSEIKQKLDRVLIGDEGHDGVIDRQARSEERIGSTRFFVGWLAAGVAGLWAAVIYLCVNLRNGQ